MDIIVDDRYSTTTEMKALPIIRQVCRARPDGFYHMPKYRSGMWDGYISLMKGLREFPTGLLSIVIRELEKTGWTVNIIDNTTVLPSRKISDDSLKGIKLRDYQYEAAEIMTNSRRGVAGMATNSGKTEVMAAILWSLNLPQTLVIVHRKELMYQTARRLEKRLGCKVGIYGDGVKSKKNITVAMIQTLAKDKKIDYTGNQVIVVDECHHLSSNQMMDVIFNIPGSYRYGFSGTPLKYELLPDMKLAAATGDILYTITNDYLVKGGYSAVPKVHMHVVESYDVVDWEMDYKTAYDKLIVNGITRNVLIAKLARESKSLVLILVNRIDHGKKLADLLPNSIFVSGSDEAEYRNSVLDRMRTDDSGIFIATPIYDEGIDVPAVDTIILAAGGKSHVKLLQRIGRGLRKKENKENILTVHDFLDDTNMYLLEHSQERADTYASEKFETIIDK
ncbi:MAG: DEAD/DEAH box helicase [Candidatus Izemoplasmatales bacterium]